jgi:Ribosomal protein L7/L12 C-terminal domain
MLSGDGQLNHEFGLGSCKLQGIKPMFAVLEFWDYAIIAVVVSAFAGGTAAYASFSFRPTDSARLARLERKIDAILRHLNIEYVDPASPERLSEEVQALANDPAKKIQAIKVHRQQTGLGLKEAKDAVEAFISNQT